jgi:hypothetical protein
MYSVPATKSTTVWLSSGRLQRSPGWLFTASQSNICGTSFAIEQTGQRHLEAELARPKELRS